MPKIEINRTRGGIPTTSGQPRAGFLPDPNPGAGRGLQEFGSTLQGVGKELIEERKRAENADYISSATIEATEKINKLEENLKDNTENFRGFADTLTNEIDNIHKDLLESAPSPEARRQLQSIFTGSRNSKFTSAFRFENRAIEQQAITRMNENLDMISNSVFRDPSRLGEIEEEFGVLIDQYGKIFDANETQRFSKAARTKLADAHIRGLINQDPEKAIKAINSGAFDKVFDASDQEKYKDGAEAQARRNLAELAKAEAQRKKQVTDLRRLGIFKDEVMQIDLDRDLESGEYGVSEYLSLSKELETRNKRQKSELESLARVEQSISNNFPLDVTDRAVRKDLDNYWDKVVKTNVENGLVELPDAVASFVDQFSYIPSEVKTNLKANLYNGSPDNIVQSAIVMDNIIARDPVTANQFKSTSDLTRMTKIVNSVNAGMSKEDAIKAADNLIVEKNSSEYKQRRDDFLNNAEEFDAGDFTNIFLNDPDEVPVGMKNDWSRLYQTYAIDHKMGLSEAKQLANKITKAQWGVTNINGEEEYMKFAPENYYNKRGLDPQWIREQLVADVTSIQPDLEDYFVTPDPTTVNTGRPGYYVNYLDENGIPQQLRDKEGSLLIWRPDINSSEEAQSDINDAKIQARAKRLLKGTPRPKTVQEIQDLADKLRRIEESR